MNRLRYAVMWLTGLAALVVMGGLSWQREQLLAHGRPVYLELAPADPRSLMQGDYMQLRYRALGEIVGELPADGLLALQVDARGVASQARLVTAEAPLAPGEVALAYRQRGGQTLIGAESFLFQEGHAEIYGAARYAELRVGGAGESALVALRDADLALLGRGAE